VRSTTTPQPALAEVNTREREECSLVVYQLAMSWTSVSGDLGSSSCEAEHVTYEVEARRDGALKHPLKEALWSSGQCGDSQLDSKHGRTMAMN
jgi:hypothetical protein